MDIMIIINQMIILFALIMMGYVAGKLKILTRDGGKVVSKLIINVTYPCLILHAVMNSDIGMSGTNIIVYLLMVILVYIIGLAIGIPVSRLLCLGSAKHKADQNLYCYMCVFANVAYMGLPVCFAIFGPESVFYVALFSIVFNLLNFSLGIYLVSGKSSNFKVMNLINPSLIAAFLSVPIAIFGFRAPDIIMEITRLAGNMTVPGVMLVIGSALSILPVKNVVIQWRIYPVALVRLFIAPVITWLILSQFITSGVVLGVLVILSGMPVAMAATMLAFEYGGNERIASSGTFITTVLSVVTIPLLVYLLLT